MDWQTISKKMLEFFSSHNALQRQTVDFWRANILFSGRWWMMAAMAVLPWPFWIVVRKRDSSARLLFAGIFVALAATVLDGLGYTMGWWHYQAPLLPMIPEAFPFNVSVLPVVTMLFIQFLPKVKPLWKALIYSTAGAFLFEQLMEWMGVYCDTNWKHIYSFAILFILYLAADRIARCRTFEPVGRA